MKLLVIGATGMIGSRIVKEALARGHEVTAATRNPDNITPQKGLTAISLDVRDEAGLAEAAAKVDTVIAAVSPRSTANAMDEAQSYADALIAGLGDTRLVLVGGAGSLNLPDGTPVAAVVPEAYSAEAKGMRAAYEKIAASNLNYTVLAPAGQIAPGERTEVFRLGGRTLLTDSEGNSRISAEDFAVALLNETEIPAHQRQIFTAAY
ncbi:hypothetical protein DDZ14_06285 [Maritimibacter sp. 55A14]|uniref:NAD(P)-dependent oxidoreductase n=1 Tax=Maritimibacter sp. 55A14 TaxID=2174844 RepID=UPI000D6136EE|nr:NAD(P)H-binding protein [Maritimibacter sp. 55A14]PWE33379.1 hypothetical protein DDZ14_06285 [Maritimibacter sp. 55A14]